MTTIEATALRFDLDLETGRVYAPGREIGRAQLQPNLERQLEGEAETFAVAVLSKGDRRYVDLALLCEGVAQALDVRTVKLAIKEQETGRRYDLHTGDGTGFRAVSRAGVPRYRFLVSMSASQMRRILQRHADPRGTFVDVLAEIETQYAASPAAAAAWGERTAAVALGPATVQVPVELDQPPSTTRTYRLSVRATLEPPYLTGTSVGAALEVANQTVSITTGSGGAVVGAALSIPAVSGPAGAATNLFWKTFTPFYLSTMDPIRIDPVAGGLELRVDVGTAEPADSAMGAKPATIWRAKGLKLAYYFNSVGNYSPHSAERIELLDSERTVVFSRTWGSGGVWGTPGGLPFVSGALLYISDLSRRHADLVWTSIPEAKYVRWVAPSFSTEVPVVEETLPVQPTVRIEATFEALADPGGEEILRVSSQSLVLRLRRDLIPDAEPEPTS